MGGQRESSYSLPLCTLVTALLLAAATAANYFLPVLLSVTWLHAFHVRHPYAAICCLLTQVVDLDALRELSWSGIPPDLRPTCWRLLLGYLPPNRERRTQVRMCRVGIWGGGGCSSDVLLVRAGRESAMSWRKQASPRHGSHKACLYSAGAAHCFTEGGLAPTLASATARLLQRSPARPPAQL